MSNLEGAAAERDLEQLTSLFRLLADRTRLNILLALAQGERNVSSLCQELGLPQPTVSHHLGLLRTNNIISNRRRGKQVFYSLSGSVSMREGLSLETNVENFSVKINRKMAQGFEGMSGPRIAEAATG
ncbi:MAG: metalloregulator ArsR/SmtB family transcription factor [Tepidisphaeraceae bacterium]|jgi:DNA-binding transcriptional ArsR family regulator